MAIYGDGIPRGHCRHGAKKAACIHESCDYYSGLGVDDPRRYFGKDSSSAEAQRLMLESPKLYKAYRAKAVEVSLQGGLSNVSGIAKGTKFE